MDIKLVTAAVKIEIALDRLEKKRHKLSKDLGAIKAKMSSEEYNEYRKRLT